MKERKEIKKGSLAFSLPTGQLHGGWPALPELSPLPFPGVSRAPLSLGQRYSYILGCLLVLRRRPGSHSHLVLLNLMLVIFPLMSWPLHEGVGVSSWCSAEDTARERQPLGSFQWSMPPTASLGRVPLLSSLCSFQGVMSIANFTFSASGCPGN